MLLIPIKVVKNKDYQLIKFSDERVRATVRDNVTTFLTQDQELAHELAREANVPLNHSRVSGDYVVRIER